MSDPLVRPASTRPPRLAPLAKLPLFLDLAGRRAVLIGGGEPLVWKAELLLAAGARAEILSPAPHEELERLAAEGRLALSRRSWVPEDLDGAAIVVADIDTPAEAEALRSAAGKRGVLVNVVDKPVFCDVQFGAIVNRSPVVIGIMTDGAAPILGQAIRRRIEAVLPPWLGMWAAAAQGFRARLRTLLPNRAERRTFWELFVDRAFAAEAPDARQAPGGREALLAGLARDVAAGSPRNDRRGEVVIVGAGPGDPDLLTLKAMRELQAADVVVHDRLVTAEILELGRREVRRIHVGKEGHGASCRQEDISALLVDLALAGERVVRLKGGDPALFGRTGEEIEACRAAGVPCRVVPGVTTASAAAAALELSLTHRDRARRVQFVTGHDRHGGLPADLDFDALADPAATLCVYMGRRTAAPLAGRLMDAGLPGSTPVLALSDVSRPGQQAVATDLAGLSRDGVTLPEGAPVILLIGAAARLSSAEPASVERYAIT